MPRCLATTHSKLTRERYATIAAEMRATASIPDAAETLAAAMAEAVGEVCPPTGYIMLVFAIAKAVVDAVVEFLAVRAGLKGMPARLATAAADGGLRVVESQASAAGNGGQVGLESQSSAAGNGVEGVGRAVAGGDGGDALAPRALAHLEAVKAENRAA